MKLASLLPDYLSVFTRSDASRVATPSGHRGVLDLIARMEDGYVQITDCGGRRIVVSRESATFPNGAILHIIAWHAAPDAADVSRGQSLATRSEVMLHGGDADGGRRTILQGEDGEEQRRVRFPATAAPGLDGNADEADFHRRDRSERSGKTTKSVASVFRKYVLAPSFAAPSSLRRVRQVGFIAISLFVVTAICLAIVAASSLGAVLTATQLVTSAAMRCVRAGAM